MKFKEYINEGLFGTSKKEMEQKITSILNDLQKQIGSKSNPTAILDVDSHVAGLKLPITGKIKDKNFRPVMNVELTTNKNHWPKIELNFHLVNDTQLGPFDIKSYKDIVNLAKSDIDNDEEFFEKY